MLFPQTEGREFAGRHPAIIVGIALTTPQYMTVVPTTTNMDMLKFPETVLIRRSAVNKLDEDSVAVAFKVAHCDPGRIQGRCGKLEDEDMKAVKVRLKNHLGL